MSDTCEPHGNLIWPADRPFPAGQTPYCRACWRAAGGVGSATGGGECRHLSREPKRIGLRTWRACGGGYGSTTADDRAGHCCGCSTPTPGVWRVGRECGAGCPGYSTARVT